MKNLLTVLAIMIATTSNAEVKAVNPGDDTGVFRQVLTDIQEQTGDSEFIQANTPQVAALNFSGEVLTVWSSEWVSNIELTSPTVTNDNIVALMTYETIMCSRSGTVSGDVNVATWPSDSVANFLVEYGATNGTNFTVVPYGGSGATTAGFVAGDTDVIFTIESRQAAIEEAGGVCFDNSKTGDINYRFVDAIITINTDPAPYTAAVEYLVANGWPEKFAGQTIYTEGDLAAMYQAGVELFK